MNMTTSDLSPGLISLDQARARRKQRLTRARGSSPSATGTWNPTTRSSDTNTPEPRPPESSSPEKTTVPASLSPLKKIAHQSSGTSKITGSISDNVFTNHYMVSQTVSLS